MPSPPTTARVRLSFAALLIACALTWACDSGETQTTRAGSVTLRAEEGVDFATGAILRPGGFANSDLYVTANGDSFRMSPGGPSPVKVRDTSWFKTGGGVLRTFDSLAEVPDDLPQPGAGSPLPQAKAHMGFVLQDMRGGFAKGWVRTLEADSITIEYAPVTASTP
ncbi:MAG: hypothetical protein H6744_14180 [Deltaproteobacteria bacterium]|nr:hypothetical protein [Deltaproteobacteria bacterium]MCB9787827.1 hypothetical protein [Deltaproteobacteria bacterium]